MLQCANCKKENLPTAKFCTGCGLPLINPAQPANIMNPEYRTGNNRKPSVPFIMVSAVALIAITIAGYFIFLNTKENKDYDPKQEVKSSTAQTTVPVIDTTALPPSVSYTANNGKLVFQTDCFVIITGSYAEESNAVDAVNSMKGAGYTNCGYLWLMDYPSIADKELFSTFIGPFDNYAGCMQELSIYKQNNKYAYGIKVSYENLKTEFR